MSASTKPFVVAIAGGSGSGKSTFTRELTERFPQGTFSVVILDDYYRSRPDIGPHNIDQANFDHPDALDFELLREHLAQLRAGHPVECPVYDFKTHSRLARTHTVEPAPIILVDGVLLLSHPSVTAAFDLRIFIEASADMRLIRRLERDLNERGRPLESSLRHYLSSVREMHEVFVEPARSTAHVIIPNDRRGQATESIRQLVEFALRLPRNGP
jgi:uridine kinase